MCDLKNIYIFVVKSELVPIRWLGTISMCGWPLVARRDVSLVWFGSLEAPQNMCGGHRGNVFIHFKVKQVRLTYLLITHLCTDYQLRVWKAKDEKSRSRTHLVITELRILRRNIWQEKDLNHRDANKLKYKNKVLFRFLHAYLKVEQSWSGPWHRLGP